MGRWLVAATAAFAIVAAVGAFEAPAARAAGGMEIGIEDERLLLTQPNRAEELASDWERQGIEWVRIHARWNTSAPGPILLKPPKDFVDTDPKNSHYHFEALDNAVDTLKRHGIESMLSIAGPAPFWATANPRAGDNVLRPRADLFGHFAGVVAKHFADRVDRYLIWNEPNQAGWLLPQNTCTRSGCVPAAPHLYRKLVAKADPAIRKADPGAEVFIGELAPIGRSPISSETPMKPLTFLREYACLDSSYHRIRGGRCEGFRAQRADGIGYHPHGRRQPPDKANKDTDEAQIGDLDRLVRVLDKISATGRLRSRVNASGRFDVYLTEYGFQTNPPDPSIGVTLAQQVRYLQQASYIAYTSRRIRNLTYYQWEDEPLIVRRKGQSRYAGWQSGLKFNNGKPKPALSVFPAPFVADLDRGVFWGQVRPGTGKTTVTLWRREKTGATPVPVGNILTDSKGYFTYPFAFDRTGQYQYTWLEPAADGETEGQLRGSGVIDMTAKGRQLRTAAPASPFVPTLPANPTG